LHEYKKALEDSIKSIQFDPGHIKAYYRRAVANHKLGDLKNALKDYQVRTIKYIMRSYFINLF